MMNRFARALGGLMLVTFAGTARAELLLHFAFNQVDTDGVVFTTPDSSGRGNTGTLENLNAANLVAGKFGNALQFSGGDGSAANRVEVSDSAPDFDRTYSEFTFAAWLKPVDVMPATSATTWIAGKMGNSSNRGWQLGLTGTSPESNPHQLLFGYFNARSGGTEQEVFLGPNSALINDTWVHVAAVYKANDSVKLYINGDLAVDATGALDALNGINASEFQVGNRGNSSADSWNGLIDEVYVFDHALSAAEVRALVPEPTPFGLTMLGIVLSAWVWRGREIGPV
jgi:hypothetical protein